jgi:hypothetical protein
LPDLGVGLLGQGSGKAFFRGLLLAAALSVVWSLVGGWIARAELLRLRAGVPADDGEADPISPSRFLARKASALAFTLAVPLVIVCLQFLFLLFGGLVNRFFGIGAILTAVLLFPVLLLLSLVSITLLVGTVSYVLMPVALAAEGSDAFDAVSRAYSYLFQCPFAFARWEGTALVLAGLPLGGVLLLFDLKPDLLDPWGQALVLTAGAALSLACFWTLQSRVYLTMRRLVDQTPETELWNGSHDEPTPSMRSWMRQAAAVARADKVEQPSAGAAVSQATGSQPHARPEGSRPAAEPVRPVWTGFTFPDTLGVKESLNPHVLLILLLAGLWATLVLFGAADIEGRRWVGKKNVTPEVIRLAVRKDADQEPLTLAALLAGTVLISAMVLEPTLKMATRLMTVELVYERRSSWRAAWKFVTGTRGMGLLGTVLLTAGVELYLAALLLASLASQGVCPWGEAALAGTGAIGLLGLGALSVGAVAVEGRRLRERPEGVAGLVLANGAETLGSAAAALARGLLSTGVLVGGAWLVWWLACESVSWWGGEQVRWMRWGLDGALWPDAEPGLYWAASCAAGLWFVLLLGSALMHPVALALRWGAVIYLLARQAAEGPVAEPLELSEEKQAVLRKQPGRWRKQEEAR